MRLFVAVYPPLSVAKDLLSRAALGGWPAPRPVPAEQVHLTLQFVGDRDGKELAGVVESVERSASGLSGFGVGVVRIRTFPERGPMRLVAAETDAPGPLLELHRRLALRLSHTRSMRREKEFVPHLTLGRYPGMGLGGASGELAVEGLSFRVECLMVMESVLKPEGAMHREVARVELADLGSR